MVAGHRAENERASQRRRTRADLPRSPVRRWKCWNCCLAIKPLGIRQFAHGIDERPLVPVREPQKSFSQQETFATDVTDEEYIQAILRRMADSLFAKVREEGRSVRTLTVRVRYNDTAEDQVNQSLPEPTDLETDVYGRLHTMLCAAWRRRVSLRLVSLKLANVYDGRFRSELALGVSAQRQNAQSRLAAAIDELRRSRGHSVILRGHDFRLMTPPTDTAATLVRQDSIPNRRRVVPETREVSDYVPLRVHSHYSFLDSTLSPTAIVELAKRHGRSAVALTDTGNLHGAVEFVQAAKQAGVKPILGAELRVGDKPLLLYVESACGYHNLCRLLSRHAERTATATDEASVATQQRRPFWREEFCGLTEGLIAVSDESQIGGVVSAIASTALPLRATPPAAFQVVACPANPLRHPGRPAEIRHRAKHPHADALAAATSRRNAAEADFISARPRKWSTACKEHPDWLAPHARDRGALQLRPPFRQAAIPGLHAAGRLTAQGFFATARAGRSAPSVMERRPTSFIRK